MNEQTKYYMLGTLPEIEGKLTRKDLADCRVNSIMKLTGNNGQNAQNERVNNQTRTSCLIYIMTINMFRI